MVAIAGSQVDVRIAGNLLIQQSSPLWVIQVEMAGCAEERSIRSPWTRLMKRETIGRLERHSLISFLF